jgi:hypothetical protein
MNKIAIIHFQPLEKYPPVMNLINSIYEIENMSCSVYTSHNKNKNWFTAIDIKILRVVKQHQNSLLRYLSYIKFNVATLFHLLIKQPKTVIAFETYSVLPVYLYNFFFSNTLTFVHYHEYVSLPEINSSSAYTKFLHSIEKKLYAVCNYISQTNTERLHLFLTDYPFIESSKTFTLPNFPPSSWYEFAKLNKQENKTGITKLVHVGAVSLSTMHTKKMLEWVIDQNGKYQIDFYTDNITIDAKKIFDSIISKNINLLQGVNYFELPKILVNYDIGLTLYNGHIPNYIYNVPNKVLEYLACGLSVWYSSELVSTKEFVNKNCLNNCFELDFSNELEKYAFDEEIKFNQNPSYYKLLLEKSQIREKIGCSTP